MPGFLKTMGRVARLAAISALAAGSMVVTACREKVEELRLEDAEALDRAVDAAQEAAALDLAEDLGIEDISEDPSEEPVKVKKKKKKKREKKPPQKMWDVICE